MSNLVKLSPQERVIMIRMAQGESPAEIAKALNLSVKSVSTYRCRLLLKTGLKSNTCIALLAFQAGWVIGHSDSFIKEFKEINSGNAKRRKKAQPRVDHSTGVAGESAAK